MKQTALPASLLPTKSLIDKQLENSMSFIFQNMDTDKRGALTYSQFEAFLRMNCFDFILDFYDKSYLMANVFKQGDRVTFSDIMKFIDDQEYKNSLSCFMRGNKAEPGKPGQRANTEDICASLRTYTDMTEEE